MNATDYWIECISNALAEMEVSLTQEQIKNLAKEVEIAHEDYGMCFYSPSRSHDYEREIKTLKKELQKEQDKVTCKECNGKGYEMSYGPIHCSRSTCWKCRGEGRL